MLTNIQKWGNSQGVRLPKILLEALNWKDNENVVVTAVDNKIIIERAKERKNIKELFAGYNDEYTQEEIDWGEPVGREIW